MPGKPRAFFVTGTDTEIGKTYTACVLLRTLGARGARTLGLKPLAAGAIDTADGARNDDALALMAASAVGLPYAQVNPVLLPDAMAPHLAAARVQRRLRATQLAGFVRGTLMTARADLVLVEGAGGWRVPLNETETLADVARELGMPVLLVVGMRLGCLNHALLTAEAIARDGLRLAGWIANEIDPRMMAFDDNVATLRAHLAAPCLGVLRHGARELVDADLSLFG